MPDKSNPPAPEKAAPPIVAAFIAEFAAKVDKEYAILEEHSEGAPAISLFNLQMETLIFGLHCLDRAVFAFWGPDYRASFMDCAFGFASDAFAAALPESVREGFLEGFKKHCDARQAEYGAMKPINKDGAMKNMLTWEFSKRLCVDAEVYNPAVQIALMEWAGTILIMMRDVAEKL